MCVGGCAHTHTNIYVYKRGGGNSDEFVTRIVPRIGVNLSVPIIFCKMHPASNDCLRSKTYPSKHAYTYTYMLTYVHMYTYIHRFIKTYLHMYTCIHMRTYILKTYMYIFTYQWPRNCLTDLVCSCAFIYTHVKIYIYIHIYIRICIHTYIHTHTHTCTYNYTHRYQVHTCMYPIPKTIWVLPHEHGVPMYLHTYSPICICTCVHTYLRIYIHAYIHTYTLTYTHVYTYVHVYIHMTKTPYTQFHQCWVPMYTYLHT